MFKDQFLVGVLMKNSEINFSSNTDFILPFSLNGSNVIGKIVRLNKSVSSILKKHRYPSIISLILAEIMANCCILGSLLKFEGKFTLQISSKGPIKTLMSDFTSEGNLRAYSSFDHRKVDDCKIEDINNLEKVLPEGNIAFTTSFFRKNDRYQGITPIIEGGLSESILNYFNKSEQIDTEIKSFALSYKDSYYSGAIIIQKTPNQNNECIMKTFEEAKMFLNSLKEEEFFTEERLESLLFKLFNKFLIRTFPSKNIFDLCLCNIEKVQETIKIIEEKKLNDLLFPDGSIEVTCEFCKNRLIMDKNELEKLRYKS